MTQPQDPRQPQQTDPTTGVSSSTESHATPSPPPRPAFSAESAPPTISTGTDQGLRRQVSTSFWLWLASSAAVLLTALYAATRMDELRAVLQARVAGLNLNVEPGTVDQVVDAVLFAALGTAIMLVLVEALLAAVMHTGRSWARIALVVVMVIDLLTLLVTQDIVGGRARLGLLLHAVLMVGAAVVMFLPSANAWFRGRT